MECLARFHDDERRIPKRGKRNLGKRELRWMRLISGKRVGERQSDPDGLVGDNYEVEFRSHHRRYNKTAVCGAGRYSIGDSFCGPFRNPELDLGKASREFRQNPAEDGFRPLGSGANQQFASRSSLKVL